MNEDIVQMLYDGAVAVTQGRRAEAQELLMRVIELDENNEQAWLWLSGAVEDPADQQIALENVLALNPNNRAAQEGIRWLRERSQVGPVTVTPPATQDDWQPPAPVSEEEVSELHCWQCNASLYSVAEYCWQCNA